MQDAGRSVSWRVVFRAPAAVGALLTAMPSNRLAGVTTSRFHNLSDAALADELGARGVFVM